MASTITLQNTINWALPFLNYAPVTIGTNNEPAITSANTILQTILAPPFSWKWNRKTITFSLTPGTQDYSQAISNYGFFEIGSIALTGAQTFPLEHHEVLSAGVETSRPTFVADQTDDDAGNISFRFLPIPDQTYTVTIIYQAKPTPFTVLSGLWDTIPDQYQYIYSLGFLAMMFDFVDSTKATRFRQLFVASLLSVSEGLDEQDKELFMNAWLNESRQMQSNQLRTQAGNTGRSL